MHPLIEHNRRQIETLCQGYGVRRLEVFGSVLRDDFDSARSDVDIAVEFEPAVPGQRLQRYFGFKDALERLFARPADLVELTAMEDTRLKRLIERTKAPVYAVPY